MSRHQVQTLVPNSKAPKLYGSRNLSKSWETICDDRRNWTQCSGLTVQCTVGGLSVLSLRHQEHNWTQKNCTGAQNLMFLYDLKETSVYHVKSCLRKCSRSSTTVCRLLKVVPRYSWIRVSKWGSHKCVGISSMLGVSEVWKNKVYLSFIQYSTQLKTRNCCTQLKYLSTHSNQVGSCPGHDISD